MRILLIGQAAFAAKVLEDMTERGDNVVAVYLPPDRPGGRTDAAGGSLEKLYRFVLVNNGGRDNVDLILKVVHCDVLAHAVQIIRQGFERKYTPICSNSLSQK